MSYRGYGGQTGVDEALDSARRQAEQELVTAQRNYSDAMRNGDTENAGTYLRHLHILKQNADALGVPDRSQPQFSAREAAWLQQRPSLMNDSRRLQEVGRVADQLIAAGYQRNSDAFFQALNMRVDPKNTDTELPTPDEAVAITMGRSKYASRTLDEKRADIDRYNSGVIRLANEKSAGNRE
jgi:hypothetical protein